MAPSWLCTKMAPDSTLHRSQRYRDNSTLAIFIRIGQKIYISYIPQFAFAIFAKSLVERITKVELIYNLQYEMASRLNP
jgi:hypothetical protein